MWLFIVKKIDLVDVNEFKKLKFKFSACLDKSLKFLFLNFLIKIEYKFTSSLIK